MDIITCSIGGLANSDAASDPVASAYEAATKFAVVVAAAGDDGSDSYNDGYSYPGFNTISSPSNAARRDFGGRYPQLSRDAAYRQRERRQRSVQPEGDGRRGGRCLLLPFDVSAPAQAPLVDVTTMGDTDGLACNALPAGSLTGSYALILRGTCTFDTKALNAQNAGAIGFIYYMATSGASVSPEGINEYGPSVMISNAAGLALKSYIDANPGALVTVDLNGMEQDVTAFNLQPCVDSAGPCPALGSALAYTTPVAANQLASYSSMGPTPDGQLKPDMVAIGGFDPELGQYLDPNDPYLPAPSGMYSGTQNYDPN